MKLPDLEPIAGEEHNHYSFWERVRDVWSAFLTIVLGPVDNLTSLAALDTSNLPDGLRMYVSTLRTAFTLHKNSTQAADGITILNAVPAGRWLRNENTDGSWHSQGTWSIDPATGNDENIGSNASPIRTFAEWRRRMGEPVQQIHTTMTVTLQSAPVPPASDPIDFNVKVVDPAAVFTLRGAPTAAQQSGSLTASTDRDPAANTANDVTGTTDPGALVASLINFTASGASAWIIKNLGGANQARISVPMTIATDFDNCVEFVPSGNEAYTVTYPILIHAHTWKVSGVNRDHNPRVFIDDLAVEFTYPADGETPTAEFDVGVDTGVACRRCDLSSMNVSGCCNLQNCHTLSVKAQGGTPSIVGGMSLFGSFWYGSPTGPFVEVRRIPFTAQDFGVTINGTAYAAVDFASFDSAGAAGIFFTIGSLRSIVSNLRLKGTAHLYGDGNGTYGMDILGWDQFICSDLTKITITGGTGDVRIGGKTSLRPAFEDGGVAANMPATAACGTWAAIAAAPFNGAAVNHDNGAYVGP